MCGWAAAVATLKPGPFLRAFTAACVLCCGECPHQWSPLCALHCCAGLLAAALVGGGLQQGLLALQCLLWVAALPASLPYAAMAAGYGWQLRCTAVMWRVMRGRQQLPRFRQQVLQRLLCRRQLQHSGNGAANASAASSGGGSSGGGGSLRQLCGSMLLFMPLLLLLPTTAWFYGAALLLHAALAAPRAAAGLAAQLVRRNPANAALRQLLRCPTPGSGSGTMQYQLVQVEFDAAALPSEAVKAAAQRTTYLRAQQRHSSRWRAALQAAAAACRPAQTFAALPSIVYVLLAVLCGRPLWLSFPIRTPVAGLL